MKLATYQRQRHFAKTPEPKGIVREAQSKKLLFVVQKHRASRLHYDFRLEMDGVLRSWAVPKGPSLNPADRRLALAVEDHPLAYGRFEGTIPEGNYGAGEVIVWDTGWYEPLLVKDDELKFRLHGKKLNGEFVLVKMRGRGKNVWLLIKHRDHYASTKDITKQTNSVLSNRKLAG